jgi:hypothetical protein
MLVYSACTDLRIRSFTDKVLVSKELAVSRLRPVSPAALLPTCFLFGMVLRNMIVVLRTRATKSVRWMPETV